MRWLLFLLFLAATPALSFGQMSVAEANMIIRAPCGELPAWKRQRAWKVVSGDAESLKAIARMRPGAAPGWVRAKAFGLYPNQSHYNPVTVSGNTYSPFIRPAGGSSGGGVQGTSPLHVGPRGGVYHYTKSGKKSYAKR